MAGIPEHPEEKDPWYQGSPRGDEPAEGVGGGGGYHYPEAPEVRQAWRGDAGRSGDTMWYRTRPSGEDRNPDDAPETAAERFQRTTRARSKSIPALRSRGHWRLGLSTALFIMLIGGSADYIDPIMRVSGHVLFWALLSFGLLVSLYREQRNRWEPAARWPWPVAAVGGTVLAELLILFFGSPVIITGSVILLGLGLFVLLLLD